MNTWDASLGKNLGVSDFVLPAFDFHQFPQAAQMEVIELLGMALVQVSQAYISAGRTTALETFSLVGRLTPLRPQTDDRSLPKATQALAALKLVSSSMCTLLEIVLPGRYVNLFTPANSWPFTYPTGSEWEKKRKEKQK